MKKLIKCALAPVLAVMNFLDAFFSSRMQFIIDGFNKIMKKISITILIAAVLSGSKVLLEGIDVFTKGSTFKESKLIPFVFGKVFTFFGNMYSDKCFSDKMFITLLLVCETTLFQHVYDFLLFSAFCLMIKMANILAYVSNVTDLKTIKREWFLAWVLVPLATYLCSLFKLYLYFNNSVGPLYYCLIALGILITGIGVPFLDYKKYVKKNA